MCMYNDLRNENIIVDLKTCGESIEVDNNNRDDIALYCDFIKESFMSLSGIN